MADDERPNAMARWMWQQRRQRLPYRNLPDDLRPASLAEAYAAQEAYYGLAESIYGPVGGAILLNALTESLAEVIGTTAPRPNPAGADPMTVAATMISMLTHVAAHRYGYEFWGIRTAALVDSQARVLLWSVTGRCAPDAGDGSASPAPAGLSARPRG